jgi:nitrate/nitrite transporter NarK
MDPMASDSRAAWRNLALATISMALGFAAWGLISAFASTFSAEFELNA